MTELQKSIEQSSLESLLNYPSPPLLLCLALRHLRYTVKPPQLPPCSGLGLPHLRPDAGDVVGGVEAGLPAPHLSLVQRSSSEGAQGGVLSVRDGEGSSSTGVLTVRSPVRSVRCKLYDKPQ